MTESIAARRYRESLDEIPGSLNGVYPTTKEPEFICSLCGQVVQECIQPCPHCSHRVIWSLL